METKIKIGNEEYELRYTIRNMFVYQRITGKREFNPEELFDLYMYFYSCLIANNPNFNILADEFLNVCDKDPNLITEFIEFFTRAIAFLNQTSKHEEKKEDEDDVKKKD